MKPKETAEKLVDEYYSIFAKKLHLSESFDSKYRYSFCKPLAKECSQIAVDQMLDFSKSHGFEGLFKYWELVKQEIEKL